MDTGSSSFVRNTAADQLADIQKAHPEDLLNLLGRVYPYLRSKKWDTRVASARAIAGIVAHAPLWDPAQDEPRIKLEGEDDDQVVDQAVKKESEEDELLSFSNLDIASVIKYGGKLLGSAGKEYDDPFADLNPFDRLKKQKHNLKLKLGMAGEYLPDDIVSESDIKTESKVSPPVKKEPSRSSSPAASPELSSNPKEAAANARLRAMAKRRARNDARSNSNKVRVVDLSSSAQARRLDQDSSSSATAVKTENDYNVTDNSHSGKVVVEHKAPQVSALVSMQQGAGGKVWPFEGLCELLMVDLFDECWEIRHGATLGLREIIKVHGAGAGRLVGKSRKENNVRNKSWLEDLSCRLCCIFALDRFGDYVSDQVVAPVRESASQTLGTLLLHLPESVVHSTFRVLRQLILQKDFDLKHPIWEVCHGGMLGLRYLVSVRTDVIVGNDKYFDGIIECVLHGLKENDDDVQAMAAATLIPIAKEFVEERPSEIGTLIQVIWDSLDDLKDDLSASIGNVMDLLAKLCGFPPVLEVLEKEYSSEDGEYTFGELVPRLYPFLRHSITNVRKAVLKALDTFIDIQEQAWINSRILRLVFQNLLVEQNKDILNLSVQLCHKLFSTITKGKENPSAVFTEVFGPSILPLLTLLMTPIGAARHSYKMDVSLFIKPSGASYTIPQDSSEPATKGRKKAAKENGTNGKKASPATQSVIPVDFQVNIDNPMLLGDVTLIGFEVFLRTKFAGSEMLGRALAEVNSSELETLKPILTQYLKSDFSSQKLVAALLLEDYAKYYNASSQPACNERIEFNQYFADLLGEIIAPAPNSTGTMYRDLTPYLRAVRTQCVSLFNVFIEAAKVSINKIPQIAVVVQGEPEAGPGAFTLSNAEELSTTSFEKLKKGLSTGARITASQGLSDAHKTLIQAIDEAKEAKRNREIGLMAAAANAHVVLAGKLPAKLNPIIRSLMDSIKEEEVVDLQKRAAFSLSNLIGTLLEHRGAVANKIIKNLCTFLCVDTQETPEFHHNEKFTDIILSLKKEEAKAEGADLIAHQRGVKAAGIKRTGAKQALTDLSHKYGAELLEKAPKLAECMLGPLDTLDTSKKLEAEVLCHPSSHIGQDLIDSLSIIKALLPILDTHLYSKFTAYMGKIQYLLGSEFAVIRYAAAKCFATMCAQITAEGITSLVETVLPMVSDPLDTFKRQGAIECIYHLTQTMGVDILPYVVFLIVPVLGRMSDADKDIRLLATTTFASIIKLVPLESGIPDPPGMSEKLLAGRDREREFISQMMDPSKVQQFDLPVDIRADLRKYQQEGVNWLAFLNKYHLHGILCDDMGLGKTLQTICIVASDHYLRDEDFQKTKAPESRRLPSLVICPPSLTGHWVHEIGQYAPFLSVLHYVGNPGTRASLAAQYHNHDIVVTSYDIARNDVASMSQQSWNYCVLDEGHIIKNANSKLSKSVKMLRANHRLILSGTPIQNNVLELWSLFDFLMPGFLGTEKVFNERFAKPIAASRNAKSSSKEQEAGALALEALHKQVLPFLLRRLKEEVLADLPPKIIQDYYCELSDLQKSLYENFVKDQKAEVEDDVEHGDNKSNKQHIFQALQYMRKLCNHPALVLNPKHPQYEKVTKQLAAKHENVRNIKFAPKLQALQELLLDCGIGTPASNSVTPGSGVISQHRALIFCQLKDMLDMVENDLLKKLMPTVSFMRLDGTTDAKDRQGIVQQFNGDPSIDVLLLTTHVGGLGLNLTGADTVIFVEHDWNPMNDLQAMDRAHRIGQKKVVNVYRLITRGTLEEKIMGLQKFKLNIASSIINQQNSGLTSMDTDQLLDLFNPGISDDASTVATGGGIDDGLDETGNIAAKGKANPIAELGELWDDKQYEEEYNLDNFIQNLRK